MLQLELGGPEVHTSGRLRPIPANHLRVTMLQRQPTMPTFAARAKSGVL